MISIDCNGNPTLNNLITTQIKNCKLPFHPSQTLIRYDDILNRYVDDVQGEKYI